jgi:hypothetical protein
MGPLATPEATCPPIVLMPALRQARLACQIERRHQRDIDRRAIRPHEAINRDLEPLPHAGNHRARHIRVEPRLEDRGDERARCERLRARPQRTRRLFEGIMGNQPQQRLPYGFFHFAPG